jgi:REP element-mobilizing transposase RayT
MCSTGGGSPHTVHKEQDFAALERFLERALAAVRLRLLACCLMPNHLHLIL